MTKALGTRVIFLDIDGVMLTDADWASSENYRACLLRESGDAGFRELMNALQAVVFNLHAVRLLNRICRITGAKVVIVSSWRWHFEPEWIHQTLRRKGIEPRHFHVDYACEVTQPFPYSKLRDSQEWLSRHPDVTDWLVLDDEAERDGFENPEYVNPLVGLDTTAAVRCVQALGPKPAEPSDCSAVVFLDIDGVLLPTAAWLHAGNFAAKERLRWITTDFETIAAYADHVRRSRLLLGGRPSAWKTPHAD
ncbi:hypothetical protein HUK83_06735 [Endobacter medicaginis]|uniref:Uncharacterized protein n=1 Tax=Endobacter medicaginis TaxID=1181271 RepID=A0A850NPL5_9PROT|nr:HAD domain-containing protein [Endobacter medicaginis]NVN30030.1 hypothetical protein [Endobacter medicaginis]